MAKAASIGIAFCTEQGRILDVNPALELLLGYSWSEMRDRSMLEFLQSGSEVLTLGRIRAVVDGVREHDLTEQILVRRDGSFSRVCLTVAPLCCGSFPANFIVGSIIILVEGRAHSGREAESSEETIDGLRRSVVGLAHDFNNLLTGLLVKCELLSSSLKRSNDSARVDDILAVSKRAALLAGRLLNVAQGQGKPRKESLDISSALENILPFLRIITGEAVEVASIRALPPVRLDPFHFEQIVTNLVLNAHEALPKGGRITLSTGRNPETHPADKGQDSRVYVRISDDGKGMDANKLRKLIQSPMPDRRWGSVHGLGFSNVMHLAHLEGGEIQVESTPGAGTAVTVLFPVLNDPEDSTSSS